MKWVLVGCLAIIIAIMLSPPLHMNLLGALLISCSASSFPPSRRS